MFLRDSRDMWESGDDWGPRKGLLGAISINSLSKESCKNSSAGALYFPCNLNVLGSTTPGRPHHASSLLSLLVRSWLVKSGAMCHSIEYDLASYPYVPLSWVILMFALNPKPLNPQP